MGVIVNECVITDIEMTDSRGSLEHFVIDKLKRAGFKFTGVINPKHLGLMSWTHYPAEGETKYIQTLAEEDTD